MTKTTKLKFWAAGWGIKCNHDIWPFSSIFIISKVKMRQNRKKKNGNGKHVGDESEFFSKVAQLVSVNYTLTCSLYVRPKKKTGLQNYSVTFTVLWIKCFADLTTINILDRWTTVWHLLLCSMRPFHMYSESHGSFFQVQSKWTLLLNILGQ